jgi:uncharacterized protein (TIGR02246 family)
MIANAEQIATDILRQLERAWNAADGDGWARVFTEGADFVTVRGQYVRGRSTIAEGHRLIFSTIYKGSTNHIELLDARALGETTLLAHAHARLSVPAGPLAGEHRAVMTMVIVPAEGGWRIEGFHNTFKLDEPLGGVQGLDRFQDHADGDRGGGRP